MDEGPLLALDHLLLHGDVGHGEQLLLRQERALLEALAREQHVGQPDEAGGQHPHRRETHDRGHRPGREQRGPLRVLESPRLRRGLGEDEDHHHLEGGGDGHTQGAEESLAEHPDQGRRHQLAEQQQE